MTDDASQAHNRAVDLLQQLGLKAYEAKCFVALTRLGTATAKEISETVDVPRTRVYDATGALETMGLVEVHHASPKQYRAVSIDEAAETLHHQYDQRVNTLVGALEALEPARSGETEVTHEVWTLSGMTAIATRTQRLIDDADHEVVLIIGQADVITDALLESLRAAHDRGVEVIVGALTADLSQRLRDRLPEAEVFVTELQWLQGPVVDGDDSVSITRLMLVDQETILVSSVHERPAGEEDTESAIFGRGFENGLVVIARRLMATGLPPRKDAESETEADETEARYGDDGSERSA